MPRSDPGFFNSSLILKNLLHNQFLVAVHLEGGAAVSGTLLGWDSEYLLIREDKNLQMVPMPKVLRIQVDLEEIMSVQALSGAADEAPRLSSAAGDPAAAYQNGSAAEARESYPGPRPSAASPLPGSRGGRSRLDELVRDW